MMLRIYWPRIGMISWVPTGHEKSASTGGAFENYILLIGLTFNVVLSMTLNISSNCFVK